MKYIYISIFTLFLVACNDVTNPGNENEHEMPTTLKINIYQMDDSMKNIIDSSYALFDQPGGLLGSYIKLLPIKLKYSSEKTINYICNIELSDRSDSTNVEDLIKEIMSECESHQFFFKTRLSDYIISYNDTESKYTTENTNNKDLPVGISFKIEVKKRNTPLNDTLNVSLSHFPDKSKKDGTTPSSETDISIDFPVIISN